MSDQAVRDNGASPGPTVLVRPRPTPPLRLGERVLSFANGSGEDVGVPLGDDRPAPAPVRNWSSAVDLIQEASEAIRISEERSGELEAQLNQTVAQAAEDVRRLSGQLAGSEQRLARTEERLRAAEARAAEAEAWLVRLHDAVVSAFTPVLRRTNGDGSSGPGGLGGPNGADGADDRSS